MFYYSVGYTDEEGKYQRQAKHGKTHSLFYFLPELFPCDMAGLLILHIFLPETSVSPPTVSAYQNHETDFHCNLIIIFFACVCVLLCFVRVLVHRARKLAQQYYLVYHEPIPTAQLVQRIASVMQEYTQSGYVTCF